MECAIIQYLISSIHYSMMAGQIGYWLLAVGYLHISTFNMIAESKPQEKEMMVNLVMTFLA